MAACPMAWAKWLLPVPGGPRNRASSWRAMKAPAPLRWTWEFRNTASSAGRGDDDNASFGRLRSAPLANETLHALVAAGEAVLGDQVLPDGHGIPSAVD